MKKIVFVCIFMAFLCCVLFSCKTTEVPNTTNTTTTPETSVRVEGLSEELGDYIMNLKPERDPLPSIEDLKAVTPGMPFGEMYQIAGNAQRIEGHNIPRYAHDTKEGITVLVALVTRLDSNGEPLTPEPVVDSIIYVYPDGHEEKLTSNTQ